MHVTLIMIIRLMFDEVLLSIGEEKFGNGRATATSITSLSLLLGKIFIRILRSGYSRVRAILRKYSRGESTGRHPVEMSVKLIPAA